MHIKVGTYYIPNLHSIHYVTNNLRFEKNIHILYPRKKSHAGIEIRRNPLTSELIPIGKSNKWLTQAVVDTQTA